MTGPERACRWNEQAVAYGLHALEPDEETALREHLAGCRSCQDAVAETELVAAALAGTVEQVDPPPRLRQSILEQAAATPQVGASGTGAAAARRSGGEERASGTRTGGGRARRDRGEARGAAGSGPRSGGGGGTGPGRRRRRLVAALLTVAAVVGVVGVAGLGAYAVQLRQERDAQIARSQALADALIQLDRPGATHATLVTSDGEPVGAVVSTPSARMVMTAGLPPNDRDSSIYVLWGISTAAPEPIGTFDVDPTATPAPTVHELDPTAGESSFLGYAISLEPGRTAPPTPTEVVASGQVPT